MRCTAFSPQQSGPVAQQMPAGLWNGEHLCWVSAHTCAGQSRHCQAAMLALRPVFQFPLTNRSPIPQSHPSRLSAPDFCSHVLYKKGQPSTHQSPSRRGGWAAGSRRTELSSAKGNLNKWHSAETRPPLSAQVTGYSLCVQLARNAGQGFQKTASLLGKRLFVPPGLHTT